MSLFRFAVMSIPAVTYSLLMFVTGGVFGWLMNKWQVGSRLPIARQ